MIKSHRISIDLPSEATPVISNATNRIFEFKEAAMTSCKNRNSEDPSSHKLFRNVQRRRGPSKNIM